MTDHTHHRTRRRYRIDLDHPPSDQPATDTTTSTSTDAGGTDRPKTKTNAMAEDQTTSAATGLDAQGLPILSTATIDDRTIRFALVIGQPRLRLTFTDHDPALFGHVTGLDRDRPRLIVAEPLHLSWGFTHAEPVEHHAQRVWRAALRHCDR